MPEQVAEPSTIVWSWQPSVQPAEQARLRRWITGWAIATLAMVAIAAVWPGRTTIVMAALVAGLGVLGWVGHQRFRSTHLSIDDLGVLRAGDSTSTKQIALSDVDTVEFRQRSTGAEGLTDRSRWALVVAGPSAAVTHEFAQVAGAFNLDESTICALEAELRAEVARCSTSTMQPPSHAADAAPIGGDAPATAPQAMATPPSPRPDGRFEWRPTLSPNAGRNRVVLRCIYVGGALAIAVFAFLSEYDNGLGGAILSAAAVPGFLLLVGLAFDVMIGRNRRFMLIADQGVLTVRSGSGKEHTIGLRGATVTVDRRSQGVADGDGGVNRTTRWHLAVDSDDERLDRQFPSLGVVTNADDYVALERELRSRT